LELVKPGVSGTLPEALFGQPFVLCVPYAFACRCPRKVRLAIDARRSVERIE
jgi:hypothetical protein